MSQPLKYKLQNAEGKPLARPGCTWERGAKVVRVPGVFSYKEFPMLRCKLCHTEQHLTTCLDCTDPVGRPYPQYTPKPRIHFTCAVCEGPIPETRHRNCITCGEHCAKTRTRAKNYKYWLTHKEKWGIGTKGGLKPLKL